MTLKLKNGKATFENTYFAQVKTGTYTVLDNTITVNYTYEKGFDEGADEDYERKINETETYTIQDEKSIIQQSSGYTFNKE